MRSAWPIAARAARAARDRLKQQMADEDVTLVDIPMRHFVGVPQCGACGGPWVCTRRTGHTGRHAAGTGEHIVAVWPQRQFNAGGFVQGAQSVEGTPLRDDECLIDRHLRCRRMDKQHRRRDEPAWWTCDAPTIGDD